MYLEGRRIASGTGHEAGRELLKQMYLRHVGGEMPQILTTPLGKPYFAHSPWHFSISHTQHYVFCALSKKPVGIDAEETDRNVRPGLAARILSETERKQWEQAEDKRLALLTFWVLKEARGKLTGEGIFYPPNQTRFSLTDPRVRGMMNCLVAVIEEEDHAV